MRVAPQQYICDLNPYHPGLPADLVAREYGVDPEHIVKLASNENSLGMSPKAQDALGKALSSANRYPEQHDLIQELASHYRILADMIILGNGSNDVLDLVARTFLNNGDEAISSQYAFAVYQIATQSAGASNIVAAATDFGHNLASMLGAITLNTKLIWLANPNNPTGTFVPYDEVKKFIEQVPKHIPIVLDEAYCEYLDAHNRANPIAWVNDHPNLIIVRTFSKIYGLAGLRIGYGIMSPELAQVVNRVRQPFNANVLALSAAAAALTDASFVQKSFKANLQGKNQLIDGLDSLGLEYLPAYGNFVTFKVGNAADVSQRLLKQGMIVRPLDSYGMPGWIRVSVGLVRENQRFLDLLAKTI